MRLSKYLLIFSERLSTKRDNPVKVGLRALRTTSCSLYKFIGGHIRSVKFHDITSAFVKSYEAYSCNYHIDLVLLNGAQLLLTHILWSKHRFSQRVQRILNQARFAPAQRELSGSTSTQANRKTVRTMEELSVD